MMRMAALTAVSFALMLVFLAAAIYAFDQPVPRCKIINGREIVTGHCIPYCPPDPKECD